MTDLGKIILMITVHHEQNPSHGIDCACIDKRITEIRQLTRVHPLEPKEVQQRVDYVIRQALQR